MRQTIRAVCIAIVVVALLWVTPVFAYDETDSGNDCIDCHGVTVPSDTKGPHGGYLTTTSKCKTCHSVHAAAGGGVLLLPAATIKATCFTCHDGTSGLGVYGALVAQGIETTAISDHSIDTTSLVPGGNAATGGDANYTFSGADGDLTCSDCHSPHNANTVNDFTGDRWRSDSDTPTITYTSNRLLKKRPNDAAEDINEYGSDWCGACHKGRLVFGGSIENHPVESTDSTTPPYYYDNVSRLTTTCVTSTELGTLGQNNRGYVMPDPRSSDQAGHYPLCMQCHEDARNVGDTVLGQLAVSETFTITSADGTPTGSTDNPRFQNFPHEVDNLRLLVETADDLCTNCHDPTS